MNNPQGSSQNIPVILVVPKNSERVIPRNSVIVPSGAQVVPRDKVWRVFSLLCFEILLMLLIIIPFVLSKDLRVTFEREKFIIYFICLLLIFILALILDSVKTKSPFGYIILQGFAILLGVLVGTSVSTEPVSSVYIGLLLAYILTSSMVIVAAFNPVDTGRYHSLISITFFCAILFLVASLISYFFSPVLFLYGSMIFCILFLVSISTSILYNSQVIVEGKRLIRTPHEKVVAVTSILMFVGLLLMFLVHFLHLLNILQFGVKISDKWQ